MTPQAELMLLVMAANGGTMTKEDLIRETRRVLALTPDERRAWHRRIAPLVRAHAERALRGTPEPPG
jgi:hypothetical protein